jgi:hypothetical protein
LPAVALASAVGAAASRQAPLKRRVALGLVTAAAVPAAVFAYSRAPYEVVTQEHQATWMINEYAGTIRVSG